MFLHVVSEKAAFEWLREENGDSRLLFEIQPAAWEPKLLWVGRVNNRAELLAAMRVCYGREDLEGACWYAGHPSTEAIGRHKAAYNCGRKFIGYKK